MFPHTVTVYNTHTEEDQTTFEATTTQYITVLDGVLLDEVRAVNVRKDSMETADAVTLYIPPSVFAIDGENGGAKQYIGPKEFQKLEDKSGYWTLSQGGDCFFVKGRVVHPGWAPEQFEAAYDGVYNVTRVDIKDFGGDMSHFEVGGA